MSSITLSAGVRQNLLSLQSTADLFNVTQNRLATGKKVNSALDNPVNFFTAQGLSNRAGDLSGLLDSMSNAINTIKAADAGISAITKLVRSAQSIISQARTNTDATVATDLEAQYDDIIAQIDFLALDSGFNGINLLDGATLTVNLNEDASSTIDIVGADENTANDLGISGSTYFTVAANLDAADTELTDALTVLRTDSKSFGSSLSTVQIRQDFTKAMITTLQVGADALTLADTNEEGANMLALQTRQQLSITALSLASQSNQAVLRLFA